jgi:hypothetical protein
MRDVTAVTIVLHHPKMARQREPAGFDIGGNQTAASSQPRWGPFLFPNEKPGFWPGDSQTLLT